MPHAPSSPLDEDPDGPASTEDEGRPLTEAQQQDLARRLDLYNKNPSTGSSWNEVMARLDDRPQSNEKRET
jgi:putative addiction module component (TIGR02574 family)